MTDDAFRLTALDARRYDFGNALRGYDRARVDQFRDQVAEELERLSRANQELEAKARNFHEQLRAFRERDKALNDALISAQQLRGEIREQAQREAQLIIREAQGDSERQLETLRSEIRRAEDDLQQLWRNRRSYVQQLRQLAERQLHDLDSAELVPPPIGLSTVEMSRDAREAVREVLPAPVEPRRETPKREVAFETRELPTPVETLRELQREAPRVVSRESAPLPADPVPTNPLFEATASVAEQLPRPAQPWARPQAVESATAAVPPLMQPVPHPLPTARTAPQQLKATQAMPVQPAPQPSSQPAPVQPAVVPPFSPPVTQTPAAQPSLAPQAAVPQPVVQQPAARLTPKASPVVPPPSPAANNTLDSAPSLIPPSPQAVPPLTRPSLPTPSWLDVVDGEE